MFRGQQVVGIIPARGGSKRLPKKNIALIAGKPLLSWTAKAGLGSHFVDKVLLTTDNPEIAKVGISAGLHEVLDRPNILARDSASTSDVVLHVLKVLEQRGEQFGYLTLLQPTSPLRTTAHIDEAFQLIQKLEGIGSVSVCQAEQPLEWMGKLSSDGFLDSFIEKAELNKQSQAFQPGYQINGAIYIVPIGRFLEEKSLFLPNRMVAYVMDRQDSVDVDDEQSFRLAEWLLRQRKGKQSLD